MGVDVFVQYGVDGEPLPGQAEIARWVATALEGRREDAEVTVRIVGTEEAAALNRRYRHREGPTNVLSFPADLPPGVPVPLLGDIVVCAPMVRREAAAQGKEERCHWAHLVVHGALHLLGYDHVESSEAETMETEERRVLARLGMPDPYAEARDE